ncbi:MAG: HlyD family type I secretion periplasmic adaptor subunit [Alphaproteobacteria bacterium]|nr:MAG: HlyD family type I secretion periplasmic adaptor subunit [Alphaproteobacteria bacterium]
MKDLRKAGFAVGSTWRPAIVGWAIIGLFFGGFGAWAAIAPLNGAVVANGIIKVEGNRKSVQHLDGGSVKRLNVKEGDHVNAGDVVIVLDDNQAKAEYEVLREQYVVLRATEARLLTELAEGKELVKPAELEDPRHKTYAVTVWTGQLKQFESRRATLEGQTKVIAEKIRQLQSQIGGAEAQANAYTAQVDSVRSEADSVAPLVDKMLLPKPRLLQLQRTAFGLEGQIADAQANISKFRQAIAEQELQIAQLHHDRMAEVTKDLREIQARLLEVIPKRTSAEAILGRMEIRSPYAGKVVALNVFSVGGVIQRGEKIMDIVPDEDGLTIEAQVAVEDISDVHPGMPAEVHLTAYKQRIVPTLHGVVAQVSADRLNDPKTNAPFYIVTIKPDPEELANLTDVKLHPGMPATVMLPTDSRTAFEYIMGPLASSFRHSFKQK